MNEQQTNFDYWRELWREKTPEGRRRYVILLAVYLGLLLVGSYLAATEMAAVMAIKMPERVLAAVLVGPFGVVWAVLEGTGHIVENPGQPGPGWVLALLAHLGAWAAAVYFGIQPVNQANLNKRAIAQHQERQGQLPAAAAAKLLPIQVGVPYVTVKDKTEKRATLGLDYTGGQGHVLVTAPTRGGKGLQLTDTLLHWPGAAVIVDPKREQYERTADIRQRHYGPVYHLPGHQIRLSDYYNLRNPDDIQELHDQMLRPGEDMQRIFADKSLPLFLAIGHFAKAHNLDPVRVLLDAGEDDLHRVLAGLDRVDVARNFVRQFTNGQPPEKLTPTDRFVTSAYGTFTTRLFGYQKHIDTICPTSTTYVVPRNWVAQRATIYITFSLSELLGAGGVVAAILAGLMRDHMQHGFRQRLLVAIDELAAVKLRHLETYLATVGGYGITMLLYTQSFYQLAGVYGRAGAEAILANCAHQLWYPPAEYQTAELIANLYGTILQPHRSYSTVNRTIRQENGQMRTVPQQSVSESLVETPAYSPTEVTSLPEDQVFVFTEKGRQYRFIGKRMDSRKSFGDLLPPPKPPAVTRSHRRYTTWLPDEPVIPADSAGAETPANGEAPAETAVEWRPEIPIAEPEEVEADEALDVPEELAGGDEATASVAEAKTTERPPLDDSALM